MESSIHMNDLTALLKKQEFKDVQIKIAEVSKHPPLNRQQFEAWKNSWPLAFREDTRLDPKFTQKDFDIIHGHMQDLLSKNSTVVCRIVDPATNQVMAEGIDTRETHPLHHAVMNNVDIVAKKECELAGGLGRMKRTASQMTGGDELEQGDVLEAADNAELYVNNEDEEIESTEREAEDASSSKKTGYLCNGYDVYITHEPCAM